MKRLDQTRIFRETFLAEKLGAHLLMVGEGIEEPQEVIKKVKISIKVSFNPKNIKKAEIILRNLSKSMYFKYGSI